MSLHEGVADLCSTTGRVRRVSRVKVSKVRALGAVLTMASDSKNAISVSAKAESMLYTNYTAQVFNITLQITADITS